MLPSTGSQGTSLLEWCNHSVKPLGPQSDGEKYPTNPLSPLAATDRLVPHNTPGRVIALQPQKAYHINTADSASLKTEGNGCT